MADPGKFCDKLAENGISIATGVPGSIIKKAIASVQDRMEYVACNREDEAVAIASGAALAGKLPVVFLQNSGLGYALSPLLTLNMVYGIPILLVIGWRGRSRDAPEHRVSGKRLVAVLEAAGISHYTLGKGWKAAVEKAMAKMKSKSAPAALLVPWGGFDE